MLLAVVDVDVQRPRLQRDAREVLDLCCLCGGEEHSLAVGGQDLDDAAHFVFESDFKDTVGLVDDQALEVLENKTGSVVQVVEQSSGCCDEQVHALDQLLCLCPPVCAANDNAKCLGVLLHKLAGDAKDLQGEFTGGRDNNDTGAVARLEAHSREHFDRGNEEGKRLSATGLRSTEHVLATVAGQSKFRLLFSHSCLT